MTIKTQGGKVITKGGRVSCSCCEEPDCCPYPAAGLGVDYTADDLPDQIDVLVAALGVLDRSGSGYSGAGGTIQESEDLWTIRNQFGDIVAVKECLIAFDDAQPTTADLFADTYTVGGGFVNGGPITVTRESLCRWEGIDGRGGPVVLELEDGINWLVLFNEYPDPNEPENISGYKVGNNNDPIGDYFIDIVFATVSA